MKNVYDLMNSTPKFVTRCWKG